MEVTVDSVKNGTLTLGNDFNFEGDGVINNTVNGLTQQLKVDDEYRLRHHWIYV